MQSVKTYNTSISISATIGKFQCIPRHISISRSGCRMHRYSFPAIYFPNLIESYAIMYITGNFQFNLFFVFAEIYIYIYKVANDIGDKIDNVIRKMCVMRNDCSVHFSYLFLAPNKLQYCSCPHILIKLVHHQSYLAAAAADLFRSLQTSSFCV